MSTLLLAPAPFRAKSRVVEAGACFEWLRYAWAVYRAEIWLWSALAGFCCVLILASLLWWPVGGGVALLGPALLALLIRICHNSAGEVSGFALLRHEVASPRFRESLPGLLMLGGGCLLVLLLGQLGWRALGADVLDAADASPVVLEGRLLLFRLFFMFCLMLAAFVLGFMALCFAPTLIVLHGLPVGQALRAGLVACLKNARAFAVWGVVLGMLLMCVLLSFGLGFLIFIPVLCGSLYAAYRDVFLGT